MQWVDQQHRYVHRPSSLGDRVSHFSLDEIKCCLTISSDVVPLALRRSFALKGSMGKILVTRFRSEPIAAFTFTMPALARHHGRCTGQDFQRWKYSISQFKVRSKFCAPQRTGDHASTDTNLASFAAVSEQQQ